MSTILLARANVDLGPHGTSAPTSVRAQAARLARTMLCALSATAAGVSREEIVLARRCKVCGSQDHGKLHVPDPPLDCDVSYAGGRVLAAVGRGCRVGVDIEAVTRRKTAQKVCALGVVRPLVGDPDPLLAWVCTEAVLKATGFGLVALREPLELKPVSPGAWSLGREGPNDWAASARADWEVRALDLDAGFRGALATDVPSARIVVCGDAAQGGHP